MSITASEIRSDEDHAVATAAVELLGGAAPEWVHLIRAGRFTLRDGRGPFELDDAEAVIAASRRAVAAGEPPIDYDHQTDFGAIRGVGGRAPAAGWIKEMQARDDGIWGRVEWTEAARRAIEAREYRFLSPVFGHTQDGRVVVIRRAALTNDPAMDLTAIASKEKGMDELLKELRSTLGLPDDAGRERTVETVKAAAAASTALTSIAKELGLKDDAKAEDVVAAAKSHRATVTAASRTLKLGDGAKPEDVTKKLGEFVTAAASADKSGQDAGGEDTSASGAGAPDPNKYIPREIYDQLAQRVKTLETASAETAATAKVDAAVKAGKVTPGQREWAIQYASSDPKGFDDFVAIQPVIASNGELVEGVKPADGKGGGKLTAAELEICSQMGVSEEEYLASRDGREPKKETKQ